MIFVILGNIHPLKIEEGKKSSCNGGLISGEHVANIYT